MHGRVGPYLSLLAHFCHRITCVIKIASAQYQVQNWQLLLCYGFAVENNPFDTVDILFEAPEDDDIGVCGLRSSEA